MHRLYLLLPLAWRNVWRNTRRTMITLLVVAVGLWSILVCTACLQAWARSSRDSSLKLLTGDGQIHAPGYRSDPDMQHSFPPPAAPLRSVLNGANVVRWAPRIRIAGIVQSEFKTLPISMVGIDPRRERGLSFIADAVIDGRYLIAGDDAGLLLGRQLAQRLGTGIGKRVVLMLQDVDGRLVQAGFTVVGIYRAPNRVADQTLFIGRDVAARLLKADGRMSEIAFQVQDENTLPDVIRRLRRAAPQLDIQPWTVLKPITRAMDNLVHSFVIVWLWIMFILMALGIVNTQLMSVLERVREFGMLQALGLRPKDVILEVMAESFVLVGLGVCIGAAAGVATVAALHGGLNLGFVAKGAEWLGAQSIIYPRVDAAQFAVSSLLIWLLSMAAALWPSWRASRYSPQAAMVAG